MKCYNCDKNAMFVVGPEGKGVPLCLDCYIQFESIELQKIAMLEREINYATDNMESAMGMPGILPKFPERQPPKIIQTGGITLNNIHVSRSEIGVLNTGVIENVDSTLTVLKTQGNAELAAAVTGLSEAVIKATEITAEQKNQIIELLSALSEEAVAPKEKQKKSVIKALIQHLEDLLKGVSTITGLWNIAKTIFLKIFGI